jgi:uncharacterized membrane protein
MATTREPSREPVEQRYGATFWIGLALGWTIMAYAIWGAIQERDGTNPTILVRWVVGLALTHDLLLAPLVAIGGLLLAWLLPARVRGPIAAACATTGIIVLFAWPLLRQYGHRELNDSALPLDYTRNVIVLIALTWFVAIAVTVVRIVRARGGTES